VSHVKLLWYTLGVEYILFPTLRGIPFGDNRQSVLLPAIRCCFMSDNQLVIVASALNVS